MILGLSHPGLVTISPLRISSFEIPERLMASLRPGPECSIVVRCDCMALIRQFSPDGTISTTSPVANEPSISVPVTTVPNPDTLKNLSIANLGLPRSWRCSVVLRIWSIISFRWSSPCPLCTETCIIGDSSQTVPLKRSSNSRFRRSRVSWSTKSDLVTTTRTLLVLSIFRI